MTSVTNCVICGQPRCPGDGVGLMVPVEQQWESALRGKRIDRCHAADRQATLTGFGSYFVRPCSNA